MDFQLSEQQKALQQRVREFLEVELKPLEVEVELAEGYLSPERRAEIREKIRPLNVHSSSLPRSVGGTEFSWEDQVIINQEIG
ncbi:MAG: acyl-CoA/acyl-ACP dehydrogenase, partial [Anaerolineales bacterium]|nr:acyl-CoA/acyl-ACP dehydrogenase [Anaerolineales bacterium]